MDDNASPTSEQLGTDVAPGIPNPEAVPPRAGTMDEHRSLVGALTDLSVEDLRDLAVARGIDGAPTMTRDQLLAKLMDDPGANEL